MCAVPAGTSKSPSCSRSIWPGRPSGSSSCRPGTTSPCTRRLSIMTCSKCSECYKYKILQIGIVTEIFKSNHQLRISFSMSTIQTKLPIRSLHDLKWGVGGMKFTCFGFTRHGRTYFPCSKSLAFKIFYFPSKWCSLLLKSTMKHSSISTNKSNKNKFC